MNKFFRLRKGIYKRCRGGTREKGFGGCADALGGVFSFSRCEVCVLGFFAGGGVGDVSTIRPILLDDIF
jgi:hypothetical protein